MPRPPVPPDPADALAWSFTRHRLLGACARAVFWTYFGSRGLGLDAGDPDARRAFALRHLTPLLGLVGTAVHVAARSVLEAVRAGGPLPSADDLLAGARLTLNQAWRTSQADQVDRFWRYPGAYTALREVVYHGRLHPEETERASRRLRACLDALLAAPVLADVAACARDDVWLPEADLPVRFAPAPDLRAWAAVDLAYRHADAEAVRGALGDAAYAGAANASATRGGTAPADDAARAAIPGTPPARLVPDGPTWCVVDWKTGRPASVADEQLQLAGYALCLDAYGRRPTEGVYLGRVVDLLRREDRWYVFDADVLAQARATIAADVARQRARMADPATARPLPKAAWPLASDRRHCAACNFFALCRTELGSAAPGAAPDRVALEAVDVAVPTADATAATADAAGGVA